MTSIKILSFFLVSFFGSHHCVAQNFGFEILPAYRKAVSGEVLRNARTISDINPGFPVSWIREYGSVTLRLIHNGDTLTVYGNSNQISKKQHELLNLATTGSDIVFDVQYIQASADSKDFRTIHFEYSFAPSTEAYYHGGQEAMSAYFDEHVLSRIPEEERKAIDFGSFSFVVDDLGEIRDIKTMHSTGVSRIDDMIMECLQHMSGWEPAKNDTGEKLFQTFRFNLGNQIGC